MKTKTHGSLEYLAAENIGVPHGFTTRYGGVSQGYLASLNLAVSRGDSRENVLENYARLGEALGFDPRKLVLAHQVHSDLVYTAGEKDAGAGLFREPLPECDAIITAEPGLALVCFSADCTPILLWDPVTGAVGAIHAGWRGTVSAIAAKTIQAMGREFGSRPGDIRAAVGPNIGYCHFETDADVPQAVRQAYGAEMDAYIRRSGEKYFLDLKAINGKILENAGVTSVVLSDACTVCAPDRFWSHRVTRGQRGSQGAVIVCKGK